MQFFPIARVSCGVLASLNLNHYVSDAISEQEFNTADRMRNNEDRTTELVISAGTKTFLAGVYHFLFGIGNDLFSLDWLTDSSKEQNIQSQCSVK